MSEGIASSQQYGEDNRAHEGKEERDQVRINQSILLYLLNHDFSSKCPPSDWTLQKSRVYDYDYESTLATYAGPTCRPSYALIQVIRQRASLVGYSGTEKGNAVPTLLSTVERIHPFLLVICLLCRLDCLTFFQRSIIVRRHPIEHHLPLSSSCFASLYFTTVNRSQQRVSSITFVSCLSCISGLFLLQLLPTHIHLFYVPSN